MVLLFVRGRSDSTNSCEGDVFVPVEGEPGNFELEAMLANCGDPLPLTMPRGAGCVIGDNRRARA